MYKIIYSPKAVAEVDRYILAYRHQFLSLYTDTGIFSELEILERYEKEAIDRYEEIYSLIEERIGDGETVFGRQQDNTLLLSWRYKTIKVAWDDDEGIRYIKKVRIF
ncbi:hypothetical protein AUK10_04515 [Candidatus Gracilibacteria bacterium CG2_30_37_12]|nr:MAG: hypothetical protein AUK10_04515 [Candidatus Gracilibacteria bacterium CG2_30_37_12]